MTTETPTHAPPEPHERYAEQYAAALECLSACRDLAKEMGWISTSKHLRGVIADLSGHGQGLRRRGGPDAPEEEEVRMNKLQQPAAFGGRLGRWSRKERQ